jgi:serine/threonine protein kinase
VRRVPSDPIWQTETSGPEGDVSGPRAPTPAAEASEPPAVGDDARYAREGLLGRGGMGLVYLARDTRLDRAVALKEAARDGDTAARLAREARVTAGLEHPGIVTVHDSGTTAEGRPSYTMRLLRGRPLSTVLAEAGDRSARLLLLRHYLTACQAVAYAHAEGVIHRDLKPANIMVGRFGETQVVDWGLATRSGEGAPPGSGHARDAGDTATGSVLGTPAYMSPEQARGVALGPARYAATPGTRTQACSPPTSRRTSTGGAWKPTGTPPGSCSPGWSARGGRRSPWPAWPAWRCSRSPAPGR